MSIVWVLRFFIPRGTLGFAELDNFSCRISAILASKCAFTVFSEPAGCSFLAFWTVLKIITWQYTSPPKSSESFPVSIWMLIVSQHANGCYRLLFPRNLLLTGHRLGVAAFGVCLAISQYLPNFFFAVLRCSESNPASPFPQRPPIPPHRIPILTC